MERFLTDLRPGETARIAALDPGRPHSVRLQELGLLPGTEVRFLRRAPLGDPLALELRGYQISLRASEASCIRVESSTSAG